MNKLGRNVSVGVIVLAFGVVGARCGTQADTGPRQRVDEYVARLKGVNNEQSVRNQEIRGAGESANENLLEFVEGYTPMVTAYYEDLTRLAPPRELVESHDRLVAVVGELREDAEEFRAQLLLSSTPSEQWVTALNGLMELETAVIKACRTIESKAAKLDEFGCPGLFLT